jgi:hypothetical protein
MAIDPCLASWTLDYHLIGPGSIVLSKSRPK